MVGKLTGGRMPGSACRLSVCFMLVWGVAGAALLGQAAGGIFTASQAAHGGEIYAASCASCHGRALIGGSSSALTGRAFVERWGARPARAESPLWSGFRIGELLEKVGTTMPPGEVGSLSTLETVAVVAYLLDQNGFSPGDTDLRQDSPELEDSRLLFQPSLIEVGLEQRLLVWVDRQGREQALPAPARHYYLPRLSPDGTQVAVEVHLDKPDIWIYDIPTGALRRLTHEGSNRFPLWTLDGQRILFGSDRHQQPVGGRRIFFEGHDVYWKAADGSGPVERLTQGEHNHGPQRWTPDGRFLSFYEIHPATYRDIWMLPFQGERKPWPFLRTPSLEGGIGFSGDGRWLAHTSKETGRYEIVLRPFPGAEPKRQVTTDGGVELVWPTGNRELFYRNENKRMAVEIDISDEVTVGTPRLMFEGDYVKSPGSRASWDSLDGQRFLLLKKAPETESTQP